MQTALTDSGKKFVNSPIPIQNSLNNKRRFRRSFVQKRLHSFGTDGFLLDAIPLYFKITGIVKSPSCCKYGLRFKK